MRSVEDSLRLLRQKIMQVAALTSMLASSACANLPPEMEGTKSLCCLAGERAADAVADLDAVIDSVEDIALSEAV